MQLYINKRPRPLFTVLYGDNLGLCGSRLDRIITTESPRHYANSAELKGLHANEKFQNPKVIQLFKLLLQTPDGGPHKIFFSGILKF